jgi:ankyrin repeat protein
MKVKRLLDIDANANYKDINSRSLFLYTAEYRKSKIATLLLEYGADIDIADDDKYKRTPLYWVAKNDYSSIIKELLKKDFKIDYLN